MQKPIEERWWQGIRYEPARIYGWLVAAMQVAAAFGLDITDEQRNALLGLVLASLAVIEVLRKKVTPVVKLEDQGKVVPGAELPEVKEEPLVVNREVDRMRGRG